MSRIHLIDDRIFQEITEVKRQSQGKVPFWRKLFEQYHKEGIAFKDAEDLRDLYRKKCKQLGIKFDFTSMEDKANINRMPGARVGIIDIETLPMLAYTWGLWDQNIGLEQIVSDICVLSWAGKFLNESEMYSDILTSKEAVAKDTSRIARSCWEFLSKCDVVIGHNFSSFDIKHINSMFLKHNMPPLKQVIVDTLMIAKQNFHFSSNKLVAINKELGIRNKQENDGFPLWAGCSKGDSGSLKTMLEYNINDIFATEELALRFRPYIRNFNMGLYNDIDTVQCPVCSSTNLKSEGFYYTPAGKWESMRCQDCKCISRKKQNLLSKDKKKSLLINS